MWGSAHGAPQTRKLSALDCLRNGRHGNHMAIYSAHYFEPDCSLGYLARRVHQIGSVALEPVFAAEGLTGPQWSALVSIWFKRGATSADLARDMAHDKGAMTRLVDALEAKKWITRSRCTEDRRAVNLALTPEGEAVALRVRLRVIDCWNSWLSDWDEADVETMIVMMQRLRDTLLTKTAQGPCA